MAKIAIVGNADNETLLPMILGNGDCIGAVDEVNGSGAREVPEFVPTQHELLQLVKHWRTSALDDEFFRLYSASVGSSDIRRLPFALRRIARIASVLGQEEVMRAMDEAEAGFRKTVDAEAWRIFTTGDPREWAEFQDRVQAGLGSGDDACAGSRPAAGPERDRGSDEL